MKILLAAHPDERPALEAQLRAAGHVTVAAFCEEPDAMVVGARAEESEKAAALVFQAHNEGLRSVYARDPVWLDKLAGMQNGVVQHE